eukprot:COSAG02_NODE_89_length_38500_cov_61.646910_9_plen_98_part_00
MSTFENQGGLFEICNFLHTPHSNSYLMHCKIVESIDRSYRLSALPRASVYWLLHCKLAEPTGRSPHQPSAGPGVNRVKIACIMSEGGLDSLGGGKTD